MAKLEDSIDIVIRGRNEYRDELQKAEQAQIQHQRQQSERAAGEQARARQLAGLQQQITETRLRAQGLSEEANTVRIKAEYAERIAAAKRANDAELADRLQTLQQLRIAEARRTTQQRQQAEQGGGFGGATEARVARVGKALGVAAGIAAAAELTAGLLGGINRAIESGDISGSISEAFASLPAIGAITRTGRELREIVTGERRELERINKLTEERTAEIEKQAEANKRNRELFATATGQIADLRQQVELGRLAAGAERERVEAAIEQRQQYEAITAELRKQGLLNEELERQAFVATRAVQNQRLQEALDAEEQQRRGMVEEVIAADREIADARLRASGKTLEADLAANRQRYDDAIAQARKADNVALQGRLEVLRGIKDQEIRDDAERDRREQRAAEVRDRQLARVKSREEEIRAVQDGIRDQLTRARQQATAAPENTANQDRFLTGVREASAAEDRAFVTGQQKQIQVLERQVAQGDEMIAELRGAAEAIRAATANIGGGIF